MNEKPKNKTRILSIFLGVLVLFAVLMFAGITSFAATSGDYEYKVLKDGTAEIIEYNGNSKNLSIPSKLNGYTVTSIGSSAFWECSSLATITIPNSVTNISDFAFANCPSLTAVTIPKSVTSIGDLIFEYCSNLTKITVDSENKNYSSKDGVLFNKAKTELIQYPFGNKRTSYTIPNSVTSIGNWAFRYCENLTEVTIPNSVKSIGVLAFNCSGLKSINIPNSVTSIGSAFSGCSNLKKVTLPDSLTSIENSAFIACISLTSITIPNSVTSIDERAFYKCFGLTSVIIPQSVTSIDVDAFDDCTALKNVFYTGSAAKWNKITIEVGNGALKKAAMHYNYVVQVAQPKLSSVSNTATGVKISWGKVAGAEKYRVFYKANGESKWHKAGDTTSTSFTWTGAKNNTKYSFTVRCIDKDGNNYTSTYDTTGKSITFMSAPTVSVSNVVAGVKVSWGKVTGAVNYKVYRKTPNGSYKALGTTTSTSFVDKTAKNNTKYIYAVRCVTKDGKTTTSSYNAGKSKTFVSAPTFSVSNVVAGVQIKWSKVAGASNYAVFRKTANGSYKKIGTTTGTSFVDKTAKSGTKYIYTVRCASKDGKTYTSSYNAGKSKTFVSAPTFTVSKTSSGVQVKWSKVTGASNYAIFRKTANGSYKKIGTTTGTSFVDKTAKKGTKYIYTVRCVSKDGKSYTSSYNAGKSITR